MADHSTSLPARTRIAAALAGAALLALTALALLAPALAGAATARAADRKPPSVKWMSPKRKATLSVQVTDKQCRVRARDARGVSRVTFYVGKRKIGTDKKAPFSCRFKTGRLAQGKQKLQATATDKGGNVSSAAITVIVSTPRRQSPPPIDPNAAVATAAAPPPADPPVGISASLRYRRGADLVNTVSRMRAGGMKYSREDLEWRYIEETPGKYDWSFSDPMVAESARQGLKLIAIPDKPPDWAGGYRNPPTSGEPLAAYTAFVRKAIERYGSNGTFWAENPALPKQPITMWDIWNEPYMPFWWSPGTSDPAAYAKMFKSVVGSVREVDPAAKFMLEGETGNSSYDWPQPPWLSAMFEAVPDLARYADIVSIHPYTGQTTAAPDGCSPNRTSEGVARDWTATRFQFCRVKDVRRILDSKGASNVRLWITEIGWGTAAQSPGPRAISEAQQADNVRSVFRLLRQWKLVDGLIWYHYQTDEADPSNEESYFGLVHQDGTPKPAWQALVDETSRGL